MVDEPTTDLAAAVVSVARTRRRRFHWAAWWTAQPTEHPFEKPDAHGGGAHTRDEALRDAAQSTGRTLAEIESRWAHAWSRVMQGERAFPRAKPPSPATRQPPADAQEPSCWTVLGLPPNATLEEIKRRYRERALIAHPDRGGSPEAFRVLRRAYERACARRR